MAHSMHWLAVGALCLAGAGFIALGRWQLERAAVNRGVVDRFESAAALAPLGEPVTDAAAFRYRPIRLRGRYAAETQILLDNMTHAGIAGYQVLTPFRVEGDGLVLVNRGFLAANPDRQQLPEVGLTGSAESVASAATATAIGAATGIVVEGRIDQLPRAALRLGAQTPTRAEPLLVLSFPDFGEIEAALGARVHRFQLLLDPAAPEGFVRDWAPPANRADRNLAYAVQWFGLALLAFVLAIGMSWRGLRRGPETAP